MRHDPRLAASPEVRDILKVARRAVTLLRFFALADTPFAKPRERDRRPARISHRLRTEPSNVEFFTLFSEASSSIVESIPIPVA
jgi:hypothetical protein